MLSMKKIFIFVALFSALQLLASAQFMTVHISGIVVNDSTGAPISNHEVIIVSDSTPPANFYFYTTRLTNSSGHFDCTVENVPTDTVVGFHIKTFDCLNILHDIVVYSVNSPVTVTFSICGDIPASCEAAYTFTNANSNPMMYHFQDTSTPANLISSRYWTFGDGGTATTMDPWHTFAEPGVYHVCLTIATTTGCTSTICHEITVVNPQPGCEAHYSFITDSIHPLVYHFYDQSSGNPFAWHWTFGDGNTSTIQNPEHVYASSGVYNVCLLIEGDSCHSTFCDSITVGENPSGCESWFTFEKNFLTVSFEGHTGSTIPTEYTWNMGDPAGTILNGQNISFTYPAAGTYTVTLTTVNANGCTFTSTQVLEISGTCMLQGTVFAGDHQADHGYVELIRKDSANVLTVLETKEFGDSLGLYFFMNVPQGHYYLKATLNSTSAYYGQFTPTYHNDALNWSNAQLVELGVPQNPYDIHMRHIIAYSPGPGNISGSITQSTKNSTPVAGVEVLILDESNAPLGYAVTDASGQFTFSNVALGSYIVYPEIIGKTTNPANITLDNTNSSQVVPFTVNAASVIYGINDLAAKYFSSISEVIPNPVSDMASLIIEAKNAISINMTITDVNGKIILNTPYNLSAGANTLKLQMQSFAAGAYYLGIMVEGKTVVLRRILRY